MPPPESSFFADQNRRFSGNSQESVIGPGTNPGIRPESLHNLRQKVRGGTGRRPAGVAARRRQATFGSSSPLL
jgi:hypothetical protein